MLMCNLTNVNTFQKKKNSYSIKSTDLYIDSTLKNSIDYPIDLFFIIIYKVHFLNNDAQNNILFFKPSQ